MKTTSSNIILAIGLALSGLWIAYLAESLTSTSGGMMLSPGFYRLVVGAFLYLPAVLLGIAGSAQAMKHAERTGQLIAISTMILILLSAVGLIAPWVMMVFLHPPGR